MNLTNQLRPHSQPPGPQDAKRAFGKDITNISKGGMLDQQLKKNPHPHHPIPLAQQATQQPAQRDAIHDYEEEIFHYMINFPGRRQVVGVEGQ